MNLCAIGKIGALLKSYALDSDNIEKLLKGFNTMLDLVVEVQETVPSKA
jgi:hypothetical protein